MEFRAPLAPPDVNENDACSDGTLTGPPVAHGMGSAEPPTGATEEDAA